mgnify:CR=1 FL=1
MPIWMALDAQQIAAAANLSPENFAIMVKWLNGDGKEDKNRPDYINKLAGVISKIDLNEMDNDQLNGVLKILQEIQKLNNLTQDMVRQYGIKKIALDVRLKAQK